MNTKKKFKMMSYGVEKSFLVTDPADLHIKTSKHVSSYLAINHKGVRQKCWYM